MLAVAESFEHRRQAIAIEAAQAVIVWVLSRLRIPVIANAKSGRWVCPSPRFICKVTLVSLYNEINKKLEN
jgi:hypothetical protein